MSTPGRIGRWEVIDSLGAGGNADVYLARDGDREVAMKVLRTRKVGTEPYLRFRNEIKVVRQLQANPGILPILDASLPEQPTRNDPLGSRCRSPCRSRTHSPPPNFGRS